VVVGQFYLILGGGLPADGHIVFAWIREQTVLRALNRAVMDEIRCGCRLWCVISSELRLLRVNVSLIRFPVEINHLDMFLNLPYLLTITQLLLNH